MNNENAPEKSSGNKLKAFLFDVVRGMAIGVAFIIPGFSGGSVAAILGIYEKLINAIANVFREFKKSIATLCPIILGMVCGIVGLLFPIGWALGNYPIPTVCVFVGLALGGLPSITEKLTGKFSLRHAICFLLPCVFAVSLSFLPISADVNLFNLNVRGFLLLFLIGILGSSALVIPGISGSMLLLILGYYNPIVDLAANHLLKGNAVGHSVAVLATAGVGVIFGFIFISFIMKRLLKNRPKETYSAILGFIVGSIPTVYISTAKESGLPFQLLMPNAWYWVFGILLLLVGCALSITLYLYSKKRKKS